MNLSNNLIMFYKTNPDLIKARLLAHSDPEDAFIYLNNVLEGSKEIVGFFGKRYLTNALGFSSFYLIIQIALNILEGIKEIGLGNINAKINKKELKKLIDRLISYSQVMDEKLSKSLWITRIFSYDYSSILDKLQLAYLEIDQKKQNGMKEMFSKIPLIGRFVILKQNKV